MTGRCAFSDGGAALPFHSVGHRREKLIQILATAPADVVVFFGCQQNLAIFRPRPVKQANVFVRGVDAMDVEKARGDERAGTRRGRGRTFAEEFHIETTPPSPRAMLFAKIATVKSIFSWM